MPNDVEKRIGHFLCSVDEEFIYYNINMIIIITGIFPRFCEKEEKGEFFDDIFSVYKINFLKVSTGGTLDS